MNTFSQDIPASQAILDTHSSVRIKIEAANRAVVECVQALMEFDDPMAENIFGAKQELLRKLANTPKAQLMQIMMTGIPIFSLRIATPEFVDVLAHNEGDDAQLRLLLATFSPPISVSSLS